MVAVDRVQESTAGICDEYYLLYDQPVFAAEVLDMLEISRYELRYNNYQYRVKMQSLT